MSSIGSAAGPTVPGTKGAVGSNPVDARTPAPLEEEGSVGAGPEDFAFIAAQMQSDLAQSSAKLQRQVSDQAHAEQISAEGEQVARLHEKADAMRTGAAINLGFGLAGSAMSAISAVDSFNAAQATDAGKAISSASSTMEAKLWDTGAKLATATGAGIKDLYNSAGTDREADSTAAAQRAELAKKRVDAADQNAQAAKTVGDKSQAVIEQMMQEKSATLRAIISKF